MENCSICLESIEDLCGELTLCKHKFHPKCINKWKKIKTTCPLCRMKITEPKTIEFNGITHFVFNLFNSRIF